MITPALLLQGIGDWPWASLGVGGVLAAIVFYFYRQDRVASEKRYETLATDFRKIVEDNTRAITQLTAALDRQEHGQYGGA